MVRARIGAFLAGYTATNARHGGPPRGRNHGTAVFTFRTTDTVTERFARALYGVLDAGVDLILYRTVP